MPTEGQELASLNFESLIGGPMVAMVHAQAQAAITTVDFVKSLGFKPIPNNPQDPAAQGVGDPIYVEFQYPRELSPYDPGDPNANPPVPPKQAVYQEQVLRVPFLTMLPIPSLRIDEGTIDFLAKIDSTEYTKTDSSINLGVEADGSVGWGFGSVKLKASFSYQRTTSTGSNTTRSYSMQVHVKVVQDEIPAGLDRILSILESAIESQPATAPQKIPARRLPTGLPLDQAIAAYTEETPEASEPARLVYPLPNGQEEATEQRPAGTARA
jgi:Protein of unknown function (DUF2589)